MLRKANDATRLKHKADSKYSQNVTCRFYWHLSPTDAIGHRLNTTTSSHHEHSRNISPVANKPPNLLTGLSPQGFAMQTDGTVSQREVR